MGINDLLHEGVAAGLHGHTAVWAGEVHTRSRALSSPPARTALVIGNSSESTIDMLASSSPGKFLKTEKRGKGRELLHGRCTGTKSSRFDVTTLYHAIMYSNRAENSTARTNNCQKPLDNVQTHIARRAGIFPAHLARLLLIGLLKCGVS